MRSGNPAVPVAVHVLHSLLIVAAALLIGQPRPADAQQCDYSGFDQPCAVHDGTYRALLPEGEGPFPVMVYLYGSGGHSIAVTNHPLFQASVVDRGYALIVPAALSMEYRRGVYDTGWSLRYERGGSRDEVAFLDQVVEDLARRFPIDRERIVFVGQSRGAFLIWEIACHQPETAAAYAVHAGGYLGPLPEECGEPMRFLHSHGLTDPIVPFAGEPVNSGGATMAPIDQSLDLLARTNGCGVQEPEDLGMTLGSLHRQRWNGCAAGGSLDLMLHSGGHTMPAEWFRAVLDWFEEPPAEIEEIRPLTRATGVRPAGIFKSIPADGPVFGIRPGSDEEPAEGRRLQPPGASKKVSQ
jgi:polyhydroxybutyrate depolymerase